MPKFIVEIPRSIQHGHPIEIDANDMIDAIGRLGMTVWSRTDYDAMMERLADASYLPTGGWLEPIPHPRSV